MVDSTYSERGWWWTGRILEKSMSCLISIYFKDMRMVPEKLRKSEGTSDPFYTEQELILQTSAKII